MNITNTENTITISIDEKTKNQELWYEKYKIESTAIIDPTILNSTTVSYNPVIVNELNFNYDIFKSLLGYNYNENLLLLLL